MLSCYNLEILNTFIFELCFVCEACEVVYMHTYVCSAMKYVQYVILIMP